MQKVRGRLINFRVTDEEFNQLKIASERQGARCLSAFARNLMLSSASDNGGSHADKLKELDHRLSTLEDSMARLFGAFKGSGLNVNASEK